MVEPYVELAVHDRIATITLNNPRAGLREQLRGGWRRRTAVRRSSEIGSWAEKGAGGLARVLAYQDCRELFRLTPAPHRTDCRERVVI